MMKALIAGLALLPSLAMATATTDIQKIDQATQACLNTPDGESTVGMEGCLDQGTTDADKVLNTLYSQIVKGLKTPSGDKQDDQNNAEVLKTLITAERNWITFRDSNSLLQGSIYLGGTARGPAILDSLYQMTKARVLELDGLFND